MRTHTKGGIGPTTSCRDTGQSRAGPLISPTTRLQPTVVSRGQDQCVFLKTGKLSGILGGPGSPGIKWDGEIGREGRHLKGRRGLSGIGTRLREWSVTGEDNTSPVWDDTV